MQLYLSPFKSNPLNTSSLFKPNCLNEKEWAAPITQNRKPNYLHLKLVNLAFVSNLIFQPDTVYEIDLDLIPVLGALKEFYSAKKVTINHPKE